MILCKCCFEEAAKVLAASIDVEEAAFIEQHSIMVNKKGYPFRRRNFKKSQFAFIRETPVCTRE
jgi:hypothetical protein